jgi:tetratricopeptide (TPR) repeat protein
VIAGASALLSVGDRFGRYVIEAVLGEGGMGRVYRAKDDRLHRQVALKVLRLDTSSADPNASGDASARMMREAQAAAALDHPNAVSVFDVGELDGTLYIAMELVDGRPLRAFVGDESVSWTQKLRWLVDVARALSVAHERGLVHRDVKPENVMVRDDGVVKVLDFGIAKRVKLEAQAGHDEAGSTTQTVRGVIVGTPRYLSPEQCRGEAIDARSDQFSWGVLAYELLTGALPWKEEDSGVPLLLAIVTKEPRAIASIVPDIPAVVSATVMKAMAKTRAHRFTSLAAVVSTLEPYVGGSVRSLDEIVSGPTLASHPFTPHSERAVMPRSLPAVTPRFSRWSMVAAGAAIVLLGAGAFVAERSERASIAPAPIVTAILPAAPLAITDVPIAPSQSADAVHTYRAALQAFRDGTFDAARQSLDRAIAFDPSFAAAHLRAAILSSIVSSDELDARRSFKTATQFRSNLTPRDAELLDALEPYLQRDPSDLVETSKRLAASVAHHPEDAELAYLLGWARFDRGELTTALDAFSRAIELDPKFAQAWSWKGGCESYLGRFDEAFASLDRAITISPSGTEALWFRIMIEEQQGKCADAEADARRWIARDPEDYYAYQMLAKALFAQGKSRETVMAALEQKWARLAPERRPRLEVDDRIRLDIVSGDFASATRRAMDLEQRVASDPDELAHSEPALFLVQIYRETGDLSQAQRTAEQYMQRREAWVSPHRVDDKAIFEDPQPAMLSTLLHTGVLPAAAFEERRTQWIDGWKARTSEAFARYLWIYAYALPAETPAEASLALTILPKLPPLPPYTPQTLAAAHVGATYLLAGHVDEALTHLERAAATCVSLYDPILHTHALFALGLAREAKGRRDEACAAYRAVIDRWGSAKPRSITADKARARATALGCRR